MRYYLLVLGGGRILIAYPGDQAQLQTWWQQTQAQQFGMPIKVFEVAPTPIADPKAAPAVLISQVHQKQGDFEPDEPLGGDGDEPE